MPEQDRNSTNLESALGWAGEVFVVRAEARCDLTAVAEHSTSGTPSTRLFLFLYFFLFFFFSTCGTKLSWAEDWLGRWSEERARGSARLRVNSTSFRLKERRSHWSLVDSVENECRLCEALEQVCLQHCAGGASLAAPTQPQWQTWYLVTSALFFFFFNHLNYIYLCFCWNVFHPHWWGGGGWVGGRVCVLSVIGAFLTLAITERGSIVGRCYVPRCRAVRVLVGCQRYRGSRGSVWLALGILS